MSFASLDTRKNIERWKINIRSVIVMECYLRNQEGITADEVTLIGFAIGRGRGRLLTGQRLKASIKTSNSRSETDGRNVWFPISRPSNLVSNR